MKICENLRFLKHLIFKKFQRGRTFEIFSKWTFFWNSQFLKKVQPGRTCEILWKRAFYKKPLSHISAKRDMWNIVIMDVFSKTIYFTNFSRDGLVKFCENERYFENLNS